MLTQKRLLAIIGLSALVVASATVAAFAADQPVNMPLVNIELKGVRVRNAIDAIFRGTNLKYHVDREVSGNIGEIRLRGVTVDQAIKTVADNANLTVRMENGAYIIAPNNEVVLGVTRRQTAPATADQQSALPSESYNAAANGDAPAERIFWGPAVPEMVPIGVGLQIINPYGYPGAQVFGGSQPAFQGAGPYSSPSGGFNPPGGFNLPVPGLSIGQYATFQPPLFGFVVRY